MRAEDTVMTWKQTVECSHNPNAELRHRDICLAQAEISFKAGYEQRRREEKPSHQYAGMSNNEIFGHPG